MSPAQRVIVALDFEHAAPAARLVEQLGAAGSFYKVGLQLLTAEGPAVVRELVAAGKQVFLDLKLLEIPNSVAGAVTAAGQLGVSMVTVHASGGSAVLRAAVEAARAFPQLKVLALTVITSLRDQDLPELGVNASVLEQVVRLARLALAAGCHGVVASPHEAQALRGLLPPSALIVTPGTQLPGDTRTDQARTATPAEAVRAGATHLVIGRSISRAADPLAAMVAICAQVAEAGRHPGPIEPGWEARLAELWKLLDDLEPQLFVAQLDALVSELPPGSAIGLFERGAAQDSTGHPELAVPLYRAALAAGLAGLRRRRAMIQMASSLRNLGAAAQAAELLMVELAAPSDELDGAVRAFLALALVDLGREREAVAIGLDALSRYLPRYNRSLARYAALI